jgi:Lon protease-like protein
VVLFPTAVMPLHIFEPRYRRMVERCMEGDRRFGLLHHDPDDQGPFLMEEGRVGCVAEITAFEPLADGRSLVMVKGRERFRIEDGIESDEPYYDALVSTYGDVAPDENLVERRRRCLRLFDAVLDTLDERPEELPALDADAELSFPLACMFQMLPAWQQTLLELQDEGTRLDALARILQEVLSGDSPE